MMERGDRDAPDSSPGSRFASPRRLPPSARVLSSPSVSLLCLPSYLPLHIPLISFFFFSFHFFFLKEFVFVFPVNSHLPGLAIALLPIPNSCLCSCIPVSPGWKRQIEAPMYKSPIPTPGWGRAPIPAPLGGDALGLVPAAAGDVLLTGCCCRFLFPLVPLVQMERGRQRGTAGSGACEHGAFPALGKRAMPSCANLCHAVPSCAILCHPAPCRAMVRPARHSPGPCEGGKTPTAPQGFLPCFPHLAVIVGAVGARPASPLAGEVLLGSRGSSDSDRKGPGAPAAPGAWVGRVTCDGADPITQGFPRARVGPPPPAIPLRVRRPQMFPLTEAEPGIPGVPLPQ